MVLGTFLSIIYIVFARFETLSFDRQEKYVNLNAEKIVAVTELLKDKIALLVRKNKEHFHNKELKAVWKLLRFIGSMFLIFAVVAIVLFLTLLERVFVNVLVGWKGMKLGGLGKMLDKFEALISQLAILFFVPASVIEIVLYPLILLLETTGSINFDIYKMLTVACQGAKAPIELFVDSAVLGVAILFVKTNYSILWSVSLQEMNQSLLVKLWLERTQIFSTKFLTASIAFLLTATNPFITILRFLLSYVVLGAFFANNHVSHELSVACVNMKGFQNQELLLVDSTSVLVWLLIAPMLYITSGVVCPKGGYTSKKVIPLDVLQNLAMHIKPRGRVARNRNIDVEGEEGSMISVHISDDHSSEISSDEYSSPSLSSSEVNNNEYSSGEIESSIGSIIISELHSSDLTTIHDDRFSVSEEDESSSGNENSENYWNSLIRRRRDNILHEESDYRDCQSSNLLLHFRGDEKDDYERGSEQSESEYSLLQESDSSYLSLNSANGKISKDEKICDDGDTYADCSSLSDSSMSRFEESLQGEKRNANHEELFEFLVMIKSFVYSDSEESSEEEQQSISTITISDFSEVDETDPFDLTLRSDFKHMELHSVASIISNHNSENAEHLTSTTTKQPAVNTTEMALFGVARYVWSYVSAICSTDLFLVFAITSWVSHCERVHKLESMQKLRSNKRWKQHEIRTSIEQFRTEYYGGFAHYEKMSRIADVNRLERKKALEENKLPPYYRLCIMEHKELQQSLKSIKVLRTLAGPLSLALIVCSLGHILTEIGRRHWAIVARKYLLFIGACLGIWTDETYEAYELESLVKTFTKSDPEEATINFVPLIIGFRAILMQALGSATTLISIMVINQCGAPLFVFSSKMQKVIPPLLFFDTRETVLQREADEQNNRDGNTLRIEEWVINIRSLSIFLTESRLLVFTFNCVALFLAVSLLTNNEISVRNQAILLLFLLPYSVGSALIPIVYIGKRLNLRDSDLKVLGLGFLVRSKESIFPSQIQEQGAECSDIEAQVRDDSSVEISILSPSASSDRSIFSEIQVSSESSSAILSTSKSTLSTLFRSADYGNDQLKFGMDDTDMSEDEGIDEKADEKADKVDRESYDGGDEGVGAGEDDDDNDDDDDDEVGEEEEEEFDDDNNDDNNSGSGSGSESDYDDEEVGDVMWSGQEYENYDDEDVSGHYDHGENESRKVYNSTDEQNTTDDELYVEVDRYYHSYAKVNGAKLNNHFRMN